MRLPPFDFETYSEAGYVWDGAKWRGPAGAPGTTRGLQVVGAANYAMHPSTEVLRLAYADGHHWRPGLPAPAALLAYVERGGLLEAHNSAFEWWVWNYHCVPRYGWPPLRIEQLRCTMARARAYSLPGKLELAGSVLGLTHQKDKEGGRLLDKFSKPRNPTKADPRRRIVPVWDDPTHPDYADSLALARYNDGDTLSETELASRIPELSPAELTHWLNDQAINRRGVAVDVPAIHDCCAIVDQCIEHYDAELVALTGGIHATEVQQLLGWLHGQGLHLDSLDAEAVEDGLAQIDRSVTSGHMHPTEVEHIHRALLCRQAVGSASVKKVYALRLAVTPHGRVHDLYNYHGARTGRPTGEGPQPTNLPKAGPDVHRCGWLGKYPLPTGGCGRRFGGHRISCPWCGVLRGPAAAKPREWHPEAVDDALEVISWRSFSLLEAFFGDALLTVAGCLRGLFVAAPGYDLVSSDYTAIEGVVIACLAGEQWRIEVYRSGRSMYLESASRSFGISVAEMEAHHTATGQHHPLRDKGKRTELGLGFGGWINALRSPQIRMEGTDDELKDAVLKWRAASPALVHFWGGQRIRDDATGYWIDCRFGLEGMAINAVENPGVTYPVHRLDGTDSGVSYCYSITEDVLRCIVPGGGVITYHRPRLSPAEQKWRGQQMTYEGYNTNPKQGPPGWVLMSIYSGKFAENVTQKVAREVQMHAINNLERNGYPVVLHTYDEPVAEVPQGFGSVEQLEAHMLNVPEWCRDWPIKAFGGWRGRRYRKG